MLGWEETGGGRHTLSRSSLHRKTGDLGDSTPSAPPVGLLTSRMTCEEDAQLGTGT
jgi:hypothetical protein